MENYYDNKKSSITNEVFRDSFRSFFTKRFYTQKSA